MFWLELEYVLSFRYRPEYSVRYFLDRSSSAVETYCGSSQQQHHCTSGGSLPQFIRDDSCQDPPCACKHTHNRDRQWARKKVSTLTLTIMQKSTDSKWMWEDKLQLIGKCEKHLPTIPPTSNRVERSPAFLASRWAEEHNHTHAHAHTDNTHTK